MASMSSGSPPKNTPKRILHSSPVFWAVVKGGISVAIIWLLVERGGVDWERLAQLSVARVARFARPGQGTAFRGPSFGGILLSEETEGTGEYFDPIREMPIHYDNDDLIENRPYFLIHDDLRQEIADRAREHP